VTPEEKAVIQSAIYLRYCLSAGTAGDPPRIGRLLADVDALIFACPECNQGGHACPGDGEGIAHGETDCGKHAEPAPAAPQREWLPATFADCIVGDRVRLGSEETTVRGSNTLLWHTRNGGRQGWEHTVLYMDLEANPGMHEYPAGTACEILCDAERKASLLLQQGFPGSSVVSS
jgi:hypothetical protein